MRILDKLRAMLAEVRETSDPEQALERMGFSAERAKALAESKSIRGARKLTQDQE